MSADNWTTCPKCKALAIAKKNSLLHKAKAAYGKVSVDEFDKLRAAADAPMPDVSTLREDYELGTDPDGQFMVSYSCACNVCAWDFQYKHSQNALES